MGAIAGAATLLWRGTRQSTHHQTFSDFRVVDGDTLKCGSERILCSASTLRNCRAGRECAPGDPCASTNSLKVAVSGELRIGRVGTDRYGRTLAIITGENGDLSCWLPRGGQAIHKGQWDDGLRVARLCPRYVI